MNGIDDSSLVFDQKKGASPHGKAPSLRPFLPILLLLAYMPLQLSLH